jgi:hypothetical protein
MRAVGALQAAAQIDGSSAQTVPIEACSLAQAC